MNTWAARLLALAAATAPGVAAADTLRGEVVAVADGDTITVLDAQHQTHKIRLAGIDAPEKKQPFGQVSRQHLADLAWRHVVRVEWQHLDRYGRIIGQVWCVVPGPGPVPGQDVGQEQDLNLAQVRAGLAWHYKQYAREQAPLDRQAYAAAEDAARAAQRGLWADAAPVAPWVFRHAKAGGASDRDSER